MRDIQNATMATQQEDVAEVGGAAEVVRPELEPGHALGPVKLALFVVADLHRSRRLVYETFSSTTSPQSC